MSVMSFCLLHVLAFVQAVARGSSDTPESSLSTKHRQRCDDYVRLPKKP